MFLAYGFGFQQKVFLGIINLVNLVNNVSTVLPIGTDNLFLTILLRSPSGTPAAQVGSLVAQLPKRSYN